MNNTMVTALSVVVMCLSTSVKAAEVEVVLKDNLDGYLNGYCLDIKGGGPNIKPSDGLQVHTCYSYKGALGDDQIFDSELLAKHQLYMPKFDVCAQVEDIKASSTVSLAQCADDPRQKIVLAKDGTLRPVSDQSLCFTASLDTRRGRNGTSDHQIKDLTLAACSDQRARFQQWRYRTEMD